MNRRARPNISWLLASIGLALLWQLRPPLLELPHSLRVPLTSPALEQIVYAVVWSVLVLSLLVVLWRAVRRRWDSASQPAAIPRWLATTRPRTRAVAGPMALWPAGRPEPRFVFGERTQDEPALVAAAASPRAAAASTTAEARERPPRAARTHLTVAQPPIKEATQPLVSVLGPLAISGGKQSRRGLRAAAVELIAYLALHPQGASRDELLEALWPGDDPRRSRDRLYQAARDARRLLGENALTNEHDRYLLDREHVQVDADELEQLLRAADRANTEDARAELLEQALALFRDEPLAGSDYLWAEGELRRLRATHVDLLERVGRAFLDAGEAPRALHSAEQALQLDLLNEAFWRLAMEAESALGLREAVERRYQNLCQVLDERLGLEPAQETLMLYRRLLGQR